MDYFSSLLSRAASAASAAADACRAWEEDGDGDAVSDTAWDADGATQEALEAVAGVDPALASEAYPETRLGRLVTAARLLVLAGTDEEGRSIDLELAAKVLNVAMEA